MSLQDDLKQRTIALVSQQMATWVVEIQNHIRNHQGELVSKLDELQEAVARYDEKIDEGAIGHAMAEVVDAQPPPPPPPPAAPVGPGIDKLKLAIAAVEKGTSLSEVLMYLVNEVSQYVDRAAMFIVKGPSAIGWYAKGVHPADAVKQLNIPLSSETVFKQVSGGKHAQRISLAQNPGTAQALQKMGGTPHSALAVPLILRDKLAAILYCDSTAGEMPGPESDLIEVLVQFAAKTIDIISLAPKAAAPGATKTDPNLKAPAAPAPAARPAPAAHADDGSQTIVAPRPAPRPAAPAPAAEVGGSTVMFTAAQLQQGMQPPPGRQAPPPAPAAPTFSPEQQKAHDDAKRFARLVVSEIKLYNEAKVQEGRRNKDIYERLKEDIERGRQMYNERVPPPVRDASNYFYDELVRILAGGDGSALGSM